MKNFPGNQNISPLTFITTANEEDVVALMECMCWAQLHSETMSTQERDKWIQSKSFACRNPYHAGLKKAIFFAPSEETNSLWILLNE
jgi:hypothetical protein